MAQRGAADVGQGGTSPEAASCNTELQASIDRRDVRAMKCEERGRRDRQWWARSSRKELGDRFAIVISEIAFRGLLMSLE
jgi:hypothetical protein